MENIYLKLRELAKSIRAQNTFVASKEIQGIRLFRNSFNFSRLQEIYLSYLYNYDGLNRDVIFDKISKHVLDNDIYTDAYLLWKQKNGNKKNKNGKPEKDKRASNFSLIAGNHIKFNKEVK